MPQSKQERYKEKHPDRIKASNHEYAASGHRRERYHKIQDEAGCHMRVQDFCPGYRLIQSLTNAEVVKI